MLDFKLSKDITELLTNYKYPVMAIIIRDRAGTINIEEIDDIEYKKIFYKEYDKNRILSHMKEIQNIANNISKILESNDDDV